MTTLTYKNWSLVPSFNVVDQEIFGQGVKALSLAYGIPESSVFYLLNNGWKQSLQDSFAGPRAKAIADGESDETVANVVETSVSKRIASIKSGMVASNGGRDPLVATAKDMIEVEARKKKMKLPKGEALTTLVKAYIDANFDKVKAEAAKRAKMRKAETISIADLGIALK